MGQPGQWGLHFEAGRVSSSSSGDRCRARAWEGWRQEDWIPILLLAQLLLLTLILSLPPFFFFFLLPFFPSQIFIKDPTCTRNGARPWGEGPCSPEFTWRREQVIHPK